MSLSNSEYLSGASTESQSNQIDDSLIADKKSISQQFRILFAGREDCWGELKGGCVKEQLTEAHFLKHLRGEESLGIYPLLDDGTCNFAVVDFDFKNDEDKKEKARKNADKLIEKLEDIGIEVCWPEISRSGLIHVWLFFAEPVEAKLIRDLLTAVLTELELKIKNGLVEIFPKQDSLQKGGFGNYIHLPYFGALAGSTDTRVIIDAENSTPIPLDEFLHNATDHKVSIDQLEKAMTQIEELNLEEDAKYVEVPLTSLDPDKRRIIIETLTPYWTKGQRQDLTMYLSGFLAKERILGKDTMKLIEELAEKCGDKEIKQREAAVFKTYIKFGKHQVIVGYSGLKEILQPADLEKLSNLFVSKFSTFITDEENWPRTLSEEAFHGIAGEIVKTIEPHSEADTAALLINLLTGIGNVLNSNACYKVEGQKHAMRLFAVLVGKTAKARKGTSWGHIKNILRAVDSTYEERIQDGLSSGEGLIAAVANGSGDDEKIDKRLLLVEGEFSSILKRASREGNTLSQIIRNAWDSGNLQTLTKHDPLRARNAHISILCHITAEELDIYFKDIQTANGFGNRFLWFCVTRSKELPLGGNVNEEKLKPLIDKLKLVVEFAKNDYEIKWSEETKPLWSKAYSKLSKGGTGIVGAMTARAEAYVSRISCIYATLDQSRKIRPEHLNAALEVWRYSEDSVKYIFGGKSGNSLKDKIFRFIQNSDDWVSTTSISNFLDRNVPSEIIQACLSELISEGNITEKSEETGGKPKTIYK